MKDWECSSCEYNGIGSCNRAPNSPSDFCLEFNKYEQKQDLEDAYQIGDRIHYHSFGDLRRSARVLSSVGYGVAVLGFGDMLDNILTIMALPERKEE